MSGHTRWDQVAPLPDRTALEVQLGYVDGYILALEDAFRDLASLPVVATSEQVAKEIALYRREVRRTLSISLDAARRTRKLFQDQYEGKS